MPMSLKLLRLVAFLVLIGYPHPRDVSGMTDPRSKKDSCEIGLIESYIYPDYKVISRSDDGNIEAFISTGSVYIRHKQAESTSLAGVALKDRPDPIFKGKAPESPDVSVYALGYEVTVLRNENNEIWRHFDAGVIVDLVYLINYRAPYGFLFSRPSTLALIGSGSKLLAFDIHGNHPVLLDEFTFEKKIKTIGLSSDANWSELLWQGPQSQNFLIRVLLEDEDLWEQIHFRYGRKLMRLDNSI